MYIYVNCVNRHEKVDKGRKKDGERKKKYQKLGPALSTPIATPRKHHR